MFTLHILSLFPESIKPYLETSIMKRAQDKGLFRYFVYNLTDWTVRNTRRVDDNPYGGGAGTILTIEPLAHALRDLREEHGTMEIIYFSPRGELHNQRLAEEYSWKAGNYCIICGHYEGIDERIFSLFNIRQISIGEYILSSWELASLIWIDSVVRHIPGVISDASLREESFSEALGGKKEYAQYSRPEIFEWISVPEILLSGDQKKIKAYNHSHTH